MDNIKIITTQPSDSNFYLFENLPKEIYPADSSRFKLPETINQEFFEACYVLTSNGKPQARAISYNNPHLNYQNKKSFCIGNYESIEDVTVSRALLDYICSEAKRKGAEFLIGPMNGSTWDNYRFSAHHNHSNFFLEPYHHLYYNLHFLNSGFEVISRYFSSFDNHIKCDHPVVLKRENEIKELGVTFRNINVNEYESELMKLYEFNSVAFKTNFLYTPINQATFIKKYAETKKIINPEFVIIAEDANKNIIAYFFCITDLFNTKEKSLIVKTAARHPDKKWKGLGNVMGNMIYRKAIELNYTSAVHAFIFEDGTSINLSKNYSGEVYKNYALYGKTL